MQNILDILPKIAGMTAPRLGSSLMVACLASIIFGSFHPAADSASKKTVNCLDKIVVFRDGQSMLGTGFITNVDGRRVAASFPSSLSPSMRIFDLNNKNIPYDALIIPGGKDASRYLVFYKLSEPESAPSPMEAENDILGNISIGHKIFVFGCVPGSKTITQDKGKITGIGPQNIETSSNIPTDIEGDPLISAESEKSLGIVRCQKRVLKKKKSFVPYAIRFDNIEEFKEYTLDEIKDDLLALKKIQNILLQNKAQIARYSQEVQTFLQNLTDPKTVTLAKINDLDLSLKSIQTEIPSLRKTIVSMASKLKLPQMKSLARSRMESLQSLDDEVQSAIESMKTLREQYHDYQNTKQRDKKAISGEL